MIDEELLRSARKEFEHSKKLAERAIAQLDEDLLFRRPAPGANSVAILMRHIAGNLASRFTDFLTTDGEKPWRDREGEFADPPADRAALLAEWEEGWCVLFDVLEELRAGDLVRTVTIRGEPHTVIRALDRQVAHYGYHVGQIVLLARLLRGDAWEWLSVPPGGSAAYNESMGYRPDA